MTANLDQAPLAKIDWTQRQPYKYGSMIVFPMGHNFFLGALNRQWAEITRKADPLRVENLVLVPRSLGAV